MAKFMKPTNYKQPQPSETPAAVPEEAVGPVRAKEAAIVQPKEAPAAGPKETPVCGINGCTTWYDDPVIMKRHYERQHGVGVKNLNQPKPRNPEVKLA